MGLATILFGVGYTFFATIVVISAQTGVPTLNTWRIPFGGPTGFFARSFERPGELFDYLKADGRLWYLWQVTVPFAWVMVAMPEIAAIGSVVLLTNIVSTFSPQHQIMFHYMIVFLPALALGAIHGLGAMRGRWQTVMVGVVIAMIAWTGFLWGTLPFSRAPHVHWTPDNPVAAAGQEIISYVPDGRVVSAQHLLTAHLAHREQIYLFPNPFSALYYGSDIVEMQGTRLAQSDDVEYVVLRSFMDDYLTVIWERERDAYAVPVSFGAYWVSVPGAAPFHILVSTDNVGVDFQTTATSGVGG